MGESAEGKGLVGGSGKVWVRIGGWLGTMGVVFFPHLPGEGC